MRNTIRKMTNPASTLRRLFSSKPPCNQAKRSGKCEDIEVLNPSHSLHPPDRTIDDSGKQDEREPSFRQPDMHFEGGSARSKPLSRAIICGPIGDNFREAF